MDSIAKKEMRSIDVAESLNLTISSSRKYIRLLMDYRVIEVSGHVVKGGKDSNEPIYRIASDADRVRDFLAELNFTAAPKAYGHKGIAPPPGHHYHTARDDRPVTFIPDQRPIFRDWAVAAFFGPAVGSAS